MLVALVAVLAAGLAPAVMAGTGGSDGDRSQFMVEGLVQYVDFRDEGDYDYVVLTVTTGTKDVKDLARKNMTMTLKLPKSVLVIECVPPPGSVVIPLSRVTTGCRVMARGTIVRAEQDEYVPYRFHLMSYAAAPVQ
jgi:hypothetical protein